jgi:hypothetical protein
MNELITYLVEADLSEIETLLGDLYAPTCSAIIASVTILSAGAILHAFGLVLASVFQKRWYR